MAMTNTADLIDASDLLVPTARSGRAVWDERGNSIWEWQTQPGVFSRDITDQQLQQFQPRHLRLVEAPAPGRVHEHVGRWLRAV